MVLLDQYGQAWATGDARAGGVSLQDCVELASPVPVTALSSLCFAKVACGNGHTIAMATNGDVFTWGRVLEMVPGVAEWHLPDASQGFAGEAVDVAAGEAHVVVACITGDTYAWGQNHHGQCARDPCGDRNNSFVNTPQRAEGEMDDFVARRVACGRYHTAVLSIEGAVCTFGAGLCGQLGRAAGALSAWQPARVPLAGDDAGKAAHLVVQVTCGDEHTLCLTDTGQVLAFGSSDSGQLGLGGVRSHRLPVLVRTVGKILEIMAGGSWSLLRGQNGKVYMAGKAEDDSDGDCRLLRMIVAPPRVRGDRQEFPMP
jgi:E3 ubiquitin-protein ligase HERC3